MRIWIFDNYNSLPEHGGLNRQYYFGKYLKRLGHEPVVFVGSHPHNTDMQFIEGPETFRIYQDDPFPWVMVKTSNYKSSRAKQVLTMFQYYANGVKASKHFDAPDVVIGSSPHLLTLLLALHVGKKLKKKVIVEVRDLWPESMISYGVLRPKNPLVWMLRQLEKHIYKNADSIIFTAEWAKNYIMERGWDKDHSGPIDLSKVYYVNNGVDLEQFALNREQYQVQDRDLEDPNSFKVVYAGSIRKVNHLGLLVDAALQLKATNIKFLIWGTGNELASLQQRVRDEGIDNVVFKGYVDKKYIPYIVSHADLNVLHGNSSPIFRFGMSPNKLFDYFAAGQPVLTTFSSKYNLVTRSHAGEEIQSPSAERIAESVAYFASLPEDKRAEYQKNALAAAQEYDFKNLTARLVSVIEETLKK